MMKTIECWMCHNSCLRRLKGALENKTAHGLHMHGLEAMREVPNKSCVLDGMLEKRKLTYLATGLSTRVPP